MNIQEFFRKMTSGHFWGNILAMLALVILLCLGVKYGLDWYTNHGEVVVVPNVLHKDFKEAEDILDGLDLNIEVNDTGYVKSLPPNCVLEQSIVAGEKVKPGRIIFVTINATSTPTIALPDVIDNSSYREAAVKLRAMGFKLGPPQYIPGEKDWVYGIICKGKQLSTGARVSIEDVLTIQVGDGRLNENDSINYTEPEFEYYYEDEEDEEEPVEVTSETPAPSTPEGGATTTEKPSVSATKPATPSANKPSAPSANKPSAPSTNKPSAPAGKPAPAN